MQYRKAVGPTQVLINLRKQINASNAQLVDNAMEFCESISDNTHKLRKEGRQLLHVLERDVIVAIAERLGIQTSVTFGYTSTPHSTSRLIRWIIDHYTKAQIQSDRKGQAHRRKLNHCCA